MPDDMDLAQTINEQHQQDALNEHLRYRTAIITSLKQCLDCGADIPEKRHHAVNGCKRCIDCQSLLENWRPV